MGSKESRRVMQGLQRHHIKRDQYDIADRGHRNEIHDIPRLRHYGESHWTIRSEMGDYSQQENELDTEHLMTWLGCYHQRRSECVELLSEVYNCPGKVGTKFTM